MRRCSVIKFNLVPRLTNTRALTSLERATRGQSPLTTSLSLHLRPTLTERASNTPTRSIVNLRNVAKLDVFAKQALDRKTHICCTIGPASWDAATVRKLLLSGMNILRLNFSHGTHEEKLKVVNALRACLKEFNQPDFKPSFADGILETSCAIAADIKGPKIRTGHYSHGSNEISLEAGQKITMTATESFARKQTETLLYCDYAPLASQVHEGSTILLEDGLIAMRVESVDQKADRVVCKVLNSGVLGERKGISLPGVVIKLPAMTEKDKEDVAFAVANGIDIIYASFIRKAADVLEFRKAVGSAPVKIIAKIETAEGIKNFDEILAVSDGIMVARGDMGVEIPMEKVFLAQKMMIAKCNIIGKPVICATQMLESMISSPVPTRAECTDVANAVYDGADVVMLSGETAKGKYPVEALEMMARICKEAEAALNHRDVSRAIRAALEELPPSETTPRPVNPLNRLPGISMASLRAISVGSVLAAFDLPAKCIVVCSRTGLTVQAVAKLRPGCPILLVTEDPRVAAQSLLMRGVHPLVMSQELLKQGMTNPHQVIKEIVHKMKDYGMVERGDGIVVVLGILNPEGVLTPTMRVLSVE